MISQSNNALELLRRGIGFALRTRDLWFDVLWRRPRYWRKRYWILNEATEVITILVEVACWGILHRQAPSIQLKAIFCKLNYRQFSSTGKAKLSWGMRKNDCTGYFGFWVKGEDQKRPTMVQRTCIGDAWSKNGSKQNWIHNFGNKLAYIFETIF